MKSISEEITVPTSVVVVSNDDYVIRDGNGLTVYGANGEPKRRLYSYAGWGYVSRVKRGWVAMTDSLGVMGYAVDGRDKFRIDSSGYASGLRYLPGGWLAVNHRRWVSIFHGWPSLLERTLNFSEDVTAIEPVDSKRFLIATSQHGLDSTGPAFSYRIGVIHLYAYGIPSFRLLEHQSLEETGRATIRRVGNIIAIQVADCDGSGKVFLRFLNLDLSKSSLPDYRLIGPATLATADGHLLIAQRECGGYEGGTLWDYDPAKRAAQKMVNGPYIVMQDDGS